MNFPSRISPIDFIANAFLRTEAGILAQKISNPDLFASRVFAGSTVGSEVSAISELLGNLESMFEGEPEKDQKGSPTKVNTKAKTKDEECDCERVGNEPPRTAIAPADGPEKIQTPQSDSERREELPKTQERDREQAEGDPDQEHEDVRENIIRVLDDINENIEKIYAKDSEDPSQPTRADVAAKTTEEEDLENIEAPQIGSPFPAIAAFLAGFAIEFGNFEVQSWVSGLSAGLAGFLRSTRNLVGAARSASSSFLRMLSTPIRSVLARFPHVARFFSGLMNSSVVRRLPVLGHAVTVIMDVLDTNSELKELTKQKDLGLLSEQQFVRESRTVMVRNVFRTAGTILGSVLGAGGFALISGPFAPIAGFVGGLIGAGVGRQLGTMLGNFMSPWIISNFFEDNSTEAANAVALGFSGNEDQTAERETRRELNTARQNVPATNNSAASASSPAGTPEPTPASSSAGTPEPAPAGGSGSAPPPQTSAHQQAGSPEQVSTPPPVPVPQTPPEAQAGVPEEVSTQSSNLPQQISYTPEMASGRQIYIRDRQTTKSTVVFVPSPRTPRQGAIAA